MDEKKDILVRTIYVPMNKFQRVNTIKYDSVSTDFGENPKYIIIGTYTHKPQVIIPFVI